MKKCHRNAIGAKSRPSIGGARADVFVKTERRAYGTFFERADDVHFRRAWVTKTHLNAALCGDKDKSGCTGDFWHAHASLNAE